MVPQIFSILSIAFSLPSAFTDWVPTMEQACGYRGGKYVEFLVWVEIDINQITTRINVQF